MVFWALPAHADETEISFECAKLDAKQAEELRARARLLLRTLEQPPVALLVACDDARAQVVWSGPPLALLHVKSDGNLVEAVLDAIEQRTLELGGKKAATPPAKPASPPTEPARTPRPTRAETPDLELQRRPLVERSRPLEPIGGLGLGANIEAGNDATSVTAGPRLDVALGVSAFWAGFEESARFGSSKDGDRTFLYDLEVMIGAGAPFARGYPVGIFIASGAEWFNAESDTENTGIATLGLRAAIPVEPIAITLGFDGRMRFAPPSIDTSSGGSLTLPKFTALLVIEGVLRLKSAQPIPTEDEVYQP